jgi:ParB/RepB/Spo0J family partition protein
VAKQLPDDIGRVERHAPTRFEAAPVVRAAEEALRQGGALRKVPVNQIRSNPLQSKGRSDGIADLAESIREHGLIHPPILRRVGRGKFEVVAGHRRTQAWQSLVFGGRAPAEMPAFVHRNLDDMRVLRLMIAENHYRADPDVLHDAQTIGYYAEVLSERLGREPTVRELAAEIPPGKTSIHESLVIYRALQDARLAPRVRQADKLAKSLLASVLSAPEFSTTTTALEMAASGASTKEIQAFLKARAKAAKPRAGGRPQKSVVRTPRGTWYDVTIRLRETMTDEGIAEAVRAAEEVLADLRVLLGRDHASGGDAPPHDDS